MLDSSKLTRDLKARIAPEYALHIKYYLNAEDSKGVLVNAVMMN